MNGRKLFLVLLDSENSQLKNIVLPFFLLSAVRFQRTVLSSLVDWRERLLSHFPGPPLIFTSGYSHDHDVRTAASHLQKPYSPTHLGVARPRRAGRKQEAKYYTRAGLSVFAERNFTHNILTKAAAGLPHCKRLLLH